MSGDLLQEKPAKLTAADVRAALRRRFAAPECAIVFEVAQGTGLSVHRHLDAVAMDLWPSRGMSLHGIEIKVHRADWRREKATPEKAEQIARFCDYFWIAAPVGIVPIDELPPAWGLIEVDGKGKTEAAKWAGKTEAQPVTRSFLAAMLRAAGRVMVEDDVSAALAARYKKQDEMFSKRVEEAAARKTEQNTAAAMRWNDLVRALGHELPEYFWDDKGLIAAIKVVMESGIASPYGSLRQTQRALLEMSERIGRACGDLKIPEPETMDHAYPVVAHRS